MVESALADNDALLLHTAQLAHMVFLPNARASLVSRNWDRDATSPRVGAGLRACVCVCASLKTVCQQTLSRNVGLHAF